MISFIVSRTLQCSIGTGKPADLATLVRGDGPTSTPDSTGWVTRGILGEDVAQRWDAIRSLRNYGSHSTYVRIEMPTFALESIEVLAKEIDALYTEG